MENSKRDLVELAKKHAMGLMVATYNQFDNMESFTTEHLNRLEKRLHDIISEEAVGVYHALKTGEEKVENELRYVFNKVAELEKSVETAMLYTIGKKLDGEGNLVPLTEADEAAIGGVMISSIPESQEPVATTVVDGMVVESVKGSGEPTHAGHHNNNNRNNNRQMNNQYQQQNKPVYNNGLKPITPVTDLSFSYTDEEQINPHIEKYNFVNQFTNLSVMQAISDKDMEMVVNRLYNILSRNDIMFEVRSIHPNPTFAIHDYKDPSNFSLSYISYYPGERPLSIIVQPKDCVLKY